MSEGRFPFEEFAAFANDDDSDGHRLAEFLEKKKGRTKRPERVFSDFQPDRFSLNKQIVRLRPLVENDAREMVGNQAVEKMECSQMKAQEQAPVEQDTNPNQLPNATVTKSTDKNGNTAQALSPRKQLPSAVRKSGGVSPGDRLRRYSLKRQSNVCWGRRTLLKEFNNTTCDSNFSPHLCSTPIKSTKANDIEGSKNNDIPEVEPKEKDTSELERCSAKHAEMVNLMSAMLNELEHSRALEKTASKSPSAAPPNRSYTVNKGATPGQVVLTPVNVPTDAISQNANLLKSPVQKSANEVVNITVKNIVTSPQLQDKSLDRIPGSPRSDKQQSGIVSEVCVTRSNSAISLAIATEKSNASLPGSPRTPRNIKAETFVCSPRLNKDANSKDQSSSKTPCVSIPREVVNSTLRKENNSANNEIEVVDLEETRETQGKTLQKSVEAEINTSVKNGECNNSAIPKPQHVENDNIRLVDILTDDEDENLQNVTQSEASGAPLNLVGACRKRRITRSSTTLGNQSSRNRLAMDVGLVPPRAHVHPLNLHCKAHRDRQKRRVLNKAPNTPINGEKHAAELKAQLARLTNYEILDLRKRNSLGKVFPTSGRKSPRYQLMKKNQDQLDKEIQVQILKRNLLNEVFEECPGAVTTSSEQSLTVVSRPLPEDELRAPTLSPQNVIHTEERPTSPAEGQKDRLCITAVYSLDKSGEIVLGPEQFLPAPDEFRDAVEVADIVTVSSAIPSPESSPKRPSTQSSEDDYGGIVKLTQQSITANSTTKSRGRPKKSMSDIVKKYIDVSAKRKKKKSFNQSKRSLYNKGESGSEDSIVHTPLNEVLRRSDPSVEQNPMEIFSPPAPFQIKIPTPRKNQKIAESTDGTEEVVFKKPQLPPPRGRGRPKNPKHTKIISQPEISDDKTSDAAESENETSLRRSKRGHIPLKNSWSFRSNDPTPLFQVMFQEQLKKKIERLNKKNVTAKGIATQTLPIASSTAQSASALKTRSSTKKSSNRNTRQPKFVKLNSPNILGDTNASSTSSTTKLSNKPIQLSPIMQTSVAHAEETHKPSGSKSNNVKVVAPSKNRAKTKLKNGLERSHILLNATPVDHINTIFDRLIDADKHQQSVHKVRNDTTNIATKKDTTNKATKKDTTNKATKKDATKSLRVRLQRVDKSGDSRKEVNMVTNTATDTSASSTMRNIANSTPNVELLSWLRGITDMQPTSDKDMLFKEMHCSAAGNLVFTDLDGIDYAFYDTDEKASLGYLRFKERQARPEKKAKAYHLHFIVLAGEFKISTNKEEGFFHPGDMVAINRGSRYAIANNTDDIALLMVIKK